MIRRPPRSTRTDTLFPYTTLFRSLQTPARGKLMPLFILSCIDKPGSLEVRMAARQAHLAWAGRSEEHTSELQSLMRISYAVFCLKKKTQNILLRYPLQSTFFHANHGTDHHLRRCLKSNQLTY